MQKKKTPKLLYFHPYFYVIKSLHHRIFRSIPKGHQKRLMTYDHSIHRSVSLFAVSNSSRRIYIEKKRVLRRRKSIIEIAKQ